MELNTLINLALLFLIAMAVIGMVTSMNYIDKKIKLFINNKLNKYRSKKRYKYNIKLIDKRMNKLREL